MAAARLRSNQTGIQTRKFSITQAKEALYDIKTWLFFSLGVAANIPNAGLSNFSTLIIAGLGYNHLETSLMGIPQGAFVVFWILSGAYLNTRLPKNSRTIVVSDLQRAQGSRRGKQTSTSNPSMDLRLRRLSFSISSSFRSRSLMS